MPERAAKIHIEGIKSAFRRSGSEALGQSQQETPQSSVVVAHDQKTLGHTSLSSLNEFYEAREHIKPGLVPSSPKKGVRIHEHGAVHGTKERPQFAINGSSRAVRHMEESIDPKTKAPVGKSRSELHLKVLEPAARPVEKDARRFTSPTVPTLKLFRTSEDRHLRGSRGLRAGRALMDDVLSLDLHNLRKNMALDVPNHELVRMRNLIVVRRNMQKRKRDLDEQIKVGNKISEGHENFVTAYNMLTGIRVAVSRCAGMTGTLSDGDFSATKKLTFSMDGSELTPLSKYDFKFKDYSPLVFKELRSIFGIDPADYLMSITGKYILLELGSPGKSGSFLYYLRDFRFIIKTVHHLEHKQMRRILRDYHAHVKANPNTLITQIYGLHRLKVKGGMKRLHFVVMNNLFPPHRDIHVKYDLKGSTFGRYTRVPKGENPALPTNTLKDLNWLENREKIYFGPDKRKLFLQQLEADVRLLKKINVMDYSLLLGIHDLKKGNAALLTLLVFDPKSSDKAELIKTNPRDIVRDTDLPQDVFPGRSKYIFYGHNGGIRATNDSNEPLQQIYYLGIIDCLTNYSLRKRLETFWRSLSLPRGTVSAVPADEYGDRFLRFITEAIEDKKVKAD